MPQALCPEILTFPFQKWPLVSSSAILLSPWNHRQQSFLLPGLHIFLFSIYPLAMWRKCSSYLLLCDKPRWLETVCYPPLFSGLAVSAPCGSDWGAGLRAVILGLGCSGSLTSWQLMLPVGSGITQREQSTPEPVCGLSMRLGIFTAWQLGFVRAHPKNELSKMPTGKLQVLLSHSRSPRTSLLLHSVVQRSH